jgi:precorrin-8X/cobalt-precorrin-8 methylmutase
VTPHPIEVESFRILHERVDLSAWEPRAGEVAARIIHATADVTFAASLRVGDGAVDAAVAALRREAPVICDAEMVRAGLTPAGPAAGVPPLRAICLLSEVPAAPPGSTRSAAALALAASRHPDGALWVVGNAPTALDELLALHAAGAVRPAAVVGLPVGFVGAADAKARLWSSPLAPVSVTNAGERGGSPAAAAAVNALVRLAAGG